MKRQLESRAIDNLKDMLEENYSEILEDDIIFLMSALKQRDNLEKKLADTTLVYLEVCTKLLKSDTKLNDIERYLNSDGYEIDAMTPGKVKYEILDIMGLNNG